MNGKIERSLNILTITLILMTIPIDLTLAAGLLLGFGVVFGLYKLSEISRRTEDAGVINERR